MSQLEQQMRHRDKEMVPRILVQAMVALIFLVLVDARKIVVKGKR